MICSLFVDVMKLIEDSDCDELMKRRIIEDGETPGALWHIFDACDADKMRDLLNKVCVIFIADLPICGFFAIVTDAHWPLSRAPCFILVAAKCVLSHVICDSRQLIFSHCVYYDNI